MQSDDVTDPIYKIIDALAAGNWEYAFPDPVAYHNFIDQVGASCAKGHKGFALRFCFDDDEAGPWVLWQLFHFVRDKEPPDDMSSDSFGVQPIGLYLPREDSPDRMAIPDDDDFLNVVVYEFTFPEGVL